MANILYYPRINPIRFYKPSPSTLYHTRHMDDFEFFDTIFEWEEHRDYYQPWEKTDLIKLQLQADFGPHVIDILNLNGEVVTTVNFQQIRQNEDNPTLFIYQVDIDLSALDGGLYQLRMTSGIDDPLVLESNTISVCEIHEHTISLDYSNHQYHEGVIWDTPFFPSYRTEGGILFKSPASKDFSYEDQTLDESLLSSTPFRTFELIIGDSFGVPPYSIDIVNRILSCSTVLIDGKRYTKNEGAKWEANEQEGYPAKGWRIEMRESINRPSNIFDSNELVNARIGIAIVADSKGIGLDTGGTTYEITDVS